MSLGRAELLCSSKLGLQSLKRPKEPVGTPEKKMSMGGANRPKTESLSFADYEIVNGDFMEWLKKNDFSMINEVTVFAYFYDHKVV